MFQIIPNDYMEVVTSINKGIPVVTMSPRSAVSKAILNLAELVKQSK